MALDNVLTVKSSVILRTVSKTIRKYITRKKNIFYKIFQQLNFTEINIIKMLFESDQVFINNDIDEEYYLPIETHKHGLKIKEYICNTNVWWLCIMDFIEIINNENFNANLENDNTTLINFTCDHCVMYSSYKPLQGIFIELCIDLCSESYVLKD